MTENRSPRAGAIIAGAILLAAAGCAPASGARQPSAEQQLCASWGYEAGDPNCHRLFRRDPK